MKRLFPVLLLLAIPAFGQARSDTCGTSPGTSLGNNVTLVNCAGQTSNNLQVTSESISWTPGSTSNLLVFTIGQCSPSGGGGCPGSGYSASHLYVTDTNGSYSLGTVTVSGSTMTLTGGLGWGVDGCNYSEGCAWAGKTITVAGSSCTMVKPITLTTATVSGCPTGSGESFKGPAGVFPCTETSDIPGASQAFCWINPVSTSSDTFTVNGPSNYSLSIVLSEFSDTSGHWSLDAAACQITDCGLEFQVLSNTQTQHQPAFTLNPVLSNTGELVVFGAEHQTGPAYAYTGTYPLMMSVSGCTTSACNTGSCNTSTGYCTNQVQTAAETFASNGTVTIGDNSNAYAYEGRGENDSGTPGMIAFTTTTTAYDAPLFGPDAVSCGHNNHAFCNNSGNFNPMTTVLAMPLTNPSCIVVTEYYSSGTPTTPTASGLTFTDAGPGAVPLSGAYIRAYIAPNTSNTLQFSPSWTTAPQWAQVYEIKGGMGNCTLDGGAGSGYASNANATTLAGGNSTTGSITTVTIGDLIISMVGYSNGPPGAPDEDFRWIQPAEAAVGLAPSSQWWWDSQNAGTIDPSPTDAYGAGDSYAGITLAFKPAAAVTMVRRHGVVIQ